MSLTIKDIARLANVSTTTISRLLNDKTEGMSEDTRKRIHDIIKENNYQPSSIARGLVTKKTRTIGLIIPDISNPFFPDIVRGAEDEASKRGYNVFLCNSDYKEDKEAEYINVLKEKCVDGIIFTGNSIKTYGYLSDLVDSSIPAIMMNSYKKTQNSYGVYFDNYKGGYIAAEHLVKCGHKRIGCITGPIDIKSSQDRLKGYKDVLIENGIEIDEGIIFEGQYDVINGEVSSNKLLKDKSISAIFACSDLIAYGVYKTAYSMGLKIPEDISIIGFDDIKFSSIIHPCLTTVKQPSIAMGLTAVDMLINLIEGKKLKRKNVDFNPELIIRDSTKIHL
jgi:LacI family transcriptional regulator